MGAVYRVSRTSHAQSTTADSITLNIPAGVKIRILRVMVTGMANAAASGQEIGVFDVTTNGSGGTPTTLDIMRADPDNAPNPPSGMTAVYGYSTQPTIVATPRIRLAYQPLGGKGIENPPPGAETVFGSRSAASQVSVRGISGTGNVAIDVLEFEVI